MTKKNTKSRAKRVVRDWPSIIERLNNSASGKLKPIEFGSPGAAQVTRCRLLEEYRNLEARTEGARLFLSLAA